MLLADGYGDLIAAGAGTSAASIVLGAAAALAVPAALGVTIALVKTWLKGRADLSTTRG